MGNIVKLGSGTRPTPKPISHPADYGLAVTAADLMMQWGRDGAINRLIEMVEWLKAGKHPFDFNNGKERIDPSAATHTNKDTPHVK
jgi:hypothetical protein